MVGEKPKEEQTIQDAASKKDASGRAGPNKDAPINELEAINQRLEAGLMATYRDRVAAD